MPPVNTIVVSDFTLPTTIFGNGIVTSNPWSNPENLFLVDGDVASSNPGAGTASDVTVGGYNFKYQGVSIPQGAVIVGIEMEVIGYAGAQTSPVLTLDISLYDNTGGADDYYPYVSGFTGLTPDMTTTVLGTQTYLFASAFTVDQINNLKMNLQANGDISLDSFLVRVYFYIPADVTPVEPAPGTCIDCDSPIQIQAMYLELPFLAGESVFYLKKGSFAYPNGVPVQPGDVGACGGKIPFVFDEGKKKADGNYEENAILDTTIGEWSVLPSGVIRVDLGDITQRALDFKTPGTHVASLMSDHDANSKVIVSNNEPYNLTLVRRCQVGTVFSAPISILQEGISKVSPATKFNFKGAGVNVTQNGGDPEQGDIDIPGAGGTITPTLDSTSSTTSGNVQVPSITWEHTCSGVNRLLVVQVSMEGGKSVTGITYNGIALSFDTAIELNGVRSEIWHLIAPAVGTHDIVVTFSADSYTSCGAESFVQVDQTTPIGTVQSASGTDNNPLLVLTTTYDNSIVVDGLSTAQTPILYTPGAGQIANWSETANGDTRQGGSSLEIAGGAPDAITMDFSITQSTDWAYAAVEIKGLTTVVTAGVEVKNNGVSLGTFNILNFKPGTSAADAGGGQADITSTGGGGGGSVFTDQTPDNGTYGLLAGAVDGANTTFTVAQGIYISGTLIVFVNGLAQLQGASDDWQETDPATGTFDFIIAPEIGDIITVEYQTSAGGGGSGVSLETTVTQTAHGFSQGDIIKSSGVDNEFAEAQADVEANSEALGIVTEIVDADTFKYVSSAIQLSGAYVPVGTPGDAIFLDPAVAGGMTTTKPTTVGQIIRGLGTIIASGATMYFDIAALAEEISADSASSSDYTVNSDEGITDWFSTQILAPFFGDVSNESPWTVTANTNSQYGNGAAMSGNGSCSAQADMYSFLIGAAGGLAFGATQVSRLKFMAKEAALSNGTNPVSDINQGIGWNVGGTEITPSDVNAAINFLFYNGHVYCHAANGATATNIDLGAIDDTDLHLYDIVVTGTTSAVFYIDGILVGTITTNLPTSGLARPVAKGFNGGGGGCGWTFISHFVLSQKLS